MFFSIDISAFPKIDPSHLEFTSDYSLSLRWYDPRLIFRDLNNKAIFNSLDEKDKRYIWKPQLAFLNALGPTVVDNNLDDEFTSVTLNREDKEYMQEDMSLAREGKIHTIEILLTTLVVLHFRCRFLLLSCEYYLFHFQLGYSPAATTL